MGNTIEIVVRVRDETAAALAAVEARAKAVNDAAASASGTAATVSTNLDDEGLRAKVIEAVRTAERNIAVIIGVDLEDDGLRAKVIEAVKAAESGINVIVGIDPDADGLRERVRAEAAAASTGSKISVPVKADDSGLEQDVTAKVRRAKPDPIEVPVKTDAAQFEADFRAAMDGGVKASADADRAMRQSFTSMESGSRSLRAAMADLDPSAENAGRSIENAGNKAYDAGAKALGSGGGFNTGAVGMGAMISAAVVLAPALAALPAIAGAVAAGAATMALGFGGVVKALKDYGQQSVSSGQSGAQLALTAFNNAIAIRNGEDAIAQAKKQAAQAAQTSADQIHSAQERVASSAYALQQAELKLQDAEKSETDAQVALTQARADAENQIKDLNNSAADSSIAVQQAELSLKEARDKLQQVTSSSLSTDDQKKQAAIDLASAQQGLIDAQQRQTEAQQSANTANKAGVDGAPGVVSAQNNVTKSIQGVADAQHGLKDAQQAQADAQRALAETVKAASDQQVASAQAIAKAEQNLADTYEQQKLSADAAASSGGASANAFAKDMANLTPQAQAFVKQLLSMKGGIDELSRTAQTAMMPGLTTMLKDSAPLLPIFNDAVDRMGKVVGNAAVSFGQLMQSKAFQGDLKQILSDGADLAQKFADGMVGMVGGVADAASKAGPIVSGLGSGAKDLMTQGIPAFFAGLVTNAPGAGQAVQAVLDGVSGLLGPLGTLVGSLAGALGPALHDILPKLDDFARKLATGLMPTMGPLSKALDGLAKVAGQVLVGIGPLIPMFAHDLTDALLILSPILDAVAKLLEANHGWMGKIAGVTHLLITPLAAFAMVFDLVHDHMSYFRDLAKHLWSDVSGWFNDGVADVKKIWDHAGRDADTAWKIVYNNIVNPVKDAYGWVSGKMDSFVTLIGGLPGRFSKSGSGIWDWIRQEFLGMLNSIASLWSQLRFTTPSFHIPVPFTDGINVDSISVGVPRIGPFKAAGGPIAGGLSAIIGEAGTELLRLPGGTTVIPHANTQSMLAGGGSGSGASVLQVEWVGGNAGDEFLTWLRKNIRIRHGSDPNSVQKMLGQSF